MKVAFSLNILDGGIHNWTTKTCPTWGGPTVATGGRGTHSIACRMTANQVRDWGTALGQAGCALLMWKYDAAFMSNWSNQQAFRDVKARLAASPTPTCRRA
jgi:hypothetical protein